MARTEPTGKMASMAKMARTEPTGKMASMAKMARTEPTAKMASMEKMARTEPTAKMASMEKMARTARMASLLTSCGKTRCCLLKDLRIRRILAINGTRQRLRFKISGNISEAPMERTGKMD